MKDKLQLLIKSEENLTQSSLAEMLGIGPATISHLINGRNKPSYELLQKILVRFPNVSSDWLMLDRGEMLRDSSLTPSGMPRRSASLPVDTADGSDADSATVGAGGYAATAAIRQTTIFDGATAAGSVRRSADSDYPSPGQPAAMPDVQTARDSNISAAAGFASVSSQSRGGQQVERVVVFYTDKTFDTYIPNK